MAAILLDLAIVAIASVSNDFTAAMLVFPLRWLVMAGGFFALRWAHQAGALTLREFGWAATYLIFGFTAAALVGGAFSRFPA